MNVTTGVFGRPVYSRNSQTGVSSRPYGVYGYEGEVVTLDDLPAHNDVRWTVRKKARVLAAVMGGLISDEEVLTRYGFSEEQLTLWEHMHAKCGLDGLSAKAAVESGVVAEFFPQAIQPVKPCQISTTTHGPFLLNVGKRVAKVNGRTVRLQPNETRILAYLVHASMYGVSAGRIVSQEELLVHLYGSTRKIDPKIIEVYICKMRKAFGGLAGGSIETIWGVGYRFIAQ